MLYSVYSSLKHLEGKCPHRPGFERDYNLTDCSTDPLLDISMESSSTTTSQADDEYTCAQSRGIAWVLSPDWAEEHEDHGSNMQQD